MIKPIVDFRALSLLPVFVLMIAGAAFAQSAAGSKNLADRWRFKFNQFVIGAWWGPGASDAELALYKQAGFNIVMAGRYMQPTTYGNLEEGLSELDMARRHRLAVMFDTYTMNDRPWGGLQGPVEASGKHHPASLAELTWLYQKLAGHPALVGFMIGDDQGQVSSRSAACTAFLFDQPAPRLFPWLCGWLDPADLAKHNNPIEDPQIYPTLYNWDLPAVELARQYAAQYAATSRKCQQEGVLFWPMFNVSHDTAGDPSAPSYCPSASLVRFPAYAAVAYGAQGIWYFCYNGGSIERPGLHETAVDARAALTPLYPVARGINRQIAGWGPRLLGCASPGLFGTAFDSLRPDWPFPAGTTPLVEAEALAPPAPGKLVQAMSSGLIVGILTRRGANPLAMVVDCRTSKDFDNLPARRVTLHFAPAVRAIDVLGEAGTRRVAGHTVSLDVPAGGGQLLELTGDNLGSLTTTSSIYRPPATRTASSLPPAGLAGIRAARLRIDIFGSDPGPRYAAKYVDLNGHRIARVPANGADSWSLAVIALRPSQLGWIGETNEVVVRTERDDAWKLRSVSLAVQLPDGRWVGTNTDPRVFSSAGWAHSEGTSFGPGGVAGPISLQFPSKRAKPVGTGSIPPG